jgi:hypothetical protein
MAKNDNLTDFLTDVADAIREKKGTTEKINPQNFSDEIKSIKTSSSIWTGHVDVEGLKAIGWDDDDIAYYQEHGVNWMEENDEYYKVSEDNKALYGVVNADNYKDYKDRIVWLPKFDFSGITGGGSGYSLFTNFNRMVGMPFINIKPSQMYYAFNNCTLLTCIPPLDTSKANRFTRAFFECRSLQYVPDLDSSMSDDFTRCFDYCYALKIAPKLSYKSESKSVMMFSNTYSLEYVEILDSPAITTNPIGSAHHCLKTAKFAKLAASISLYNAAAISKESILFMIEHEAATSAITITLHADAYSRLSTDPDIVEALNNHPLVSLASA